MAENSVPMDVALTIASVTNPTSVVFDDGVLGQALKDRAKRANESYVGFAGQILDVLAARKTEHVQSIKNLEAAIDEQKKALAKLEVAQAAASSTKGLFPLAAALGMKASAMDFARRNSIIVPASTDDVWKAE